MQFRYRNVNQKVERASVHNPICEGGICVSTKVWLDMGINILPLLKTQLKGHSPHYNLDDMGDLSTYNTTPSFIYSSFNPRY